MLLDVFKVFGLKGMVCVDFLVFEDGELYLGEINMLFGFINISLYLKLWEVLGISYMVLID